MEKFARNFLWLVLLPWLVYAQIGFGMWLYYSKGWHFGAYLALSSYVTFTIPLALKLWWLKGLAFSHIYVLLAFLMTLVVIAPIASFIPYESVGVIPVLISLSVWTVLMTVFWGRLLDREITKDKNVAKFPDLEIVKVITPVTLVTIVLLRYGLLVILPILTWMLVTGYRKIRFKKLVFLLMEAIWIGALLWMVTSSIMGEKILELFNTSDRPGGVGIWPSLFIFALIAIHWSIVVSERYAKARLDEPQDVGI